MKKVNLSKRQIRYLILAIAFIAIFILIYNNHRMYNTPICKVTDVRQELTKSKINIEGHKENYYDQEITGKIKNSDFKGKLVHLNNKYAESLVYDEKYQEGDFLFIEDINKKDGKLYGTIKGVKRDYIIFGLFLIILFLILLIGEIKGKFIILSLIINVIILFIALEISKIGINFLWLTIPFILIMSSLLLILTYGIKLEALSSIVATSASVLAIGILSYIVMHFSKRIDYEFMEHLIQPYFQKDANLLFLAEIIIGGLGAIMDIAVTMTSTIKELIEQKPEITKKELFASTRAIGDDIMGTMVNVIFFTNVAGAIPFALLAMRNGIPILTTLKNHAFFEIVRFLTGSIGLILAIPISAGIAILLLRKEEK